MAVPSAVRILGRAAIVAAVVVQLAALWLSGRFEDEAERPYEPPAPAPLATLPRSETSVTAPPRAPVAPDSIPVPAPPVTVGAGAVTVPPPAPGAAPVPIPRQGRVVDPPAGGG